MDEGSWLFRVASDPKWGGGHVSRCRVLARELARHGSGTTFWLDHDDGGWTQLLRDEGFDVICEPETASGAVWNGTLVDGYDLLDAGTLNLMQGIARPLVCLEDHLPPQVNVDLTINAGASPAETRGQKSLLSGLKYALVDPSFTLITSASDTEVARLLVVMGRADTCGASIRVVRALSSFEFSQTVPALTVVLGSASPILDDVRYALTDYSGPSELLVDVQGMAALYERSDAVIVSGGVSLLECLAAGRPSCAVQTADNQAGNVRQALSTGGTIDGGDIESWDEGKFIGAIRSLCASACTRSSLMTEARRAVDGKGAERVVQAMTQLHESWSLQ